jgi:hypothetical protein
MDVFLVSSLPGGAAQLGLHSLLQTARGQPISCFLKLRSSAWTIPRTSTTSNSAHCNGL